MEHGKICEREKVFFVKSSCLGVFVAKINFKGDPFKFNPFQV